MNLLRDLRGYLATGALMGLAWAIGHGQWHPAAIVACIVITALAGAFGGFVLLISQRADAWPAERKAKAWRNVCCTATAAAAVAAGLAVWDATGRPVATGLVVFIVPALVAAVWSAVREARLRP